MLLGLSGAGPPLPAGWCAPGCRTHSKLPSLCACRYNALEEHRTFAEGLHTCGVCLEEQRGTAFVRLDCRHAWCQGCLAEAARIHVAEGSIEQIKWVPC